MKQIFFMIDIYVAVSMGMFFYDLYLKKSAGLIPIIFMAGSTTLIFSSVTWLLEQHFKQL